MTELTNEAEGYIKMTPLQFRQYAESVGMGSGIAEDIAMGVIDMCSYKNDDDRKSKGFTKRKDWDLQVPSNVPVDEHDAWYNKQEKDIAQKQNFLKNLDYANLPGKSPREKGVNVIAALAANASKNADNKSKGGKRGKDSLNEEIMNMIRGSAAGAAELVENTLQSVEKIAPGDLVDKMFDNGDNGDLTGVKALKLGQKNIDLLNKMNTFGKMGELASSERTKLIEDPTSPTKKMVRISQYSEIAKASPVTLVLPNSKVKIARKEVFITKGVRQEKSSQTLFMIVDDSGSMSESTKVAHLMGLYLNRLDLVHRGTAELYVCTFVADLHHNEWRAARTPEEALQLMQDVRGRRYNMLNGGGTDMERAIRSATAQINSLKLTSRYQGDIEIKKLVDPSLIIINDGEDRVSDDFTPPIKTHGFLLEGSHEGMKNFCHRSGGMYRELWD